MNVKRYYLNAQGQLLLISTLQWGSIRKIIPNIYISKHLVTCYNTQQIKQGKCVAEIDQSCYAKSNEEIKDQPSRKEMYS